MRKLCLICIIPVSIILLFSSCKRKKGNGFERPCHEPYTLNQLLEDYPNSKFVIRKWEMGTDVWDSIHTTASHSYEMPFYRFDNNNNLRLFAYQIDSTFAAPFIITYDTVGNEIKKDGSDVVRWFLSRWPNDSINVSFYLYKINRSYGHLKLTGTNFSKPVTLFETDNANMIGANIKISNHIKTVYLSGLIENDCSNEKREFIDSAIIPKFMLK